MKASEAIPLARVMYVPNHAHGDIDHPDCEYGTISSVRDNLVFVKFYQCIRAFGWEEAASIACNPDSLVYNMEKDKEFLRDEVYELLLGFEYNHDGERIRRIRD